MHSSHVSSSPQVRSLLKRAQRALAESEGNPIARRLQADIDPLCAMMPLLVKVRACIRIYK